MLDAINPFKALTQTRDLHNKLFSTLIGREDTVSPRSGGHERRVDRGQHERDRFVGYGRDRDCGDSGRSRPGGYGNGYGAGFADGYERAADRYTGNRDNGYGGHGGYGGGHRGGNYGGYGNYGDRGGYGGYDSCGGSESGSDCDNIDGSRGPRGRAPDLMTRREGNDGVAVTPGGYRIKGSAGNGDEGGAIEITSPDGKVSRIWGDPHFTAPDGSQVDFKKSGFTIHLPDKTQIEMSTQPGPNGTTVLQNAGVMGPNNVTGVLFSGLSSGRGKLEMNVGDARLVDRRIDDGLQTYLGNDGKLYGDNGIGGRDQRATQEWINSNEANLGQTGTSHDKRGWIGEHRPGPTHRHYG